MPLSKETKPNQTILFEQQNNKQKLQNLEARRIRNKHLNRIDFESSTNLLKCL